MLVKEEEKIFREIKTKFRIESVGCTFDRIFPKDFDFQGESHDFSEIVYVSSGRVQITENERVYLLGGGDMIIHAPMEFHRIKSDADSSPHVINLSVRVSGELPGELYKGVFHLDEEKHEEFMRCFRRAHRLKLRTALLPSIWQENFSVSIFPNTAPNILCVTRGF